MKLSCSFLHDAYKIKVLLTVHIFLPVHYTHVVKMSGKSGCFHSNHGQNIRLKEGGTEAHRVDSYNKAVVFTDQPIPQGAMFTVRLLDKGGGWAGSIVSFNTHYIPTHPLCTHYIPTHLSCTHYILTHPSYTHYIPTYPSCTNHIPKDTCSMSIHCITVLVLISPPHTYTHIYTHTHTYTEVWFYSPQPGQYSCPLRGFRLVP